MGCGWYATVYITGEREREGGGEGERQRQRQTETEGDRDRGTVRDTERAHEVI